MESAQLDPDAERHDGTLAGLDAGALAKFRSLSELREGPIPTVLDTSCVRTGLEYQLANDGRLPRSLDAVWSGHTRLFMEHETLMETWEHLPKFAGQFGVSVSMLQRMFGEGWLPLISVVTLPEALRCIDDRALAVRTLDADDYPTAALAALLSPCILLTRNTKDFAPLGVSVPTQGLDAIFAAIDLQLGETQVQAIALVPAMPVIAVGATTKWAADKVGPMAWVALVLVLAGGVLLYQRQPVVRKEKIKRVATEGGRLLLEELSRASTAVHEAEAQLGACVVSSPATRSIAAAVLRKLAITDGSWSAQQLCEELDEEVRPVVAHLRRWLHANKTTVFREVRRGGFVLGRRYSVNVSDPT